MRGYERFLMSLRPRYNQGTLLLNCSIVVGSCMCSLYWWSCLEWPVLLEASPKSLFLQIYFTVKGSQAMTLIEWSIAYLLSVTWLSKLSWNVLSKISLLLML